MRQEAPAAFEEMISENVIIGRNPVIEALKNDREIEKLLIGKGQKVLLRRLSVWQRISRFLFIRVIKSLSTGLLPAEIIRGRRICFCIQLCRT